jgi:conjugal transfer pilus assembly protein TraD
MLVALIALLAAPTWVTTVVLGLAAVAVAMRAARLAGRLGRGRRARASDGIRLGVTRRGRPVSLEDRELSAHALILGASGAGKTTALVTILDQQIRRGTPVIAIDMKGSPTFAAQLGRAAAAAGRPFKLWTPDGPGFWNPLQHGNATEGKDKLICTERFSEPHYQRAAERYVQSLLQVLRHAHPGSQVTLDDVVRFMDPKRLPRLLRNVPPDLAARVQDYRSGLTPDQLSAIRGLQTRLAVITEADAGAYLRPAGPGTIDLCSALDGPEVVLFSLNSSRYGKFAAQLGTMVVQDLICTTGLRLEHTAPGARLRPALIAIDEFSGIGGEHVVALFARGREAGVGALVATQEMADLDRAGHGVRDQVIGNTALKLVLRQDVPASAHTVAQIAGTERVWEETRQIGGGLLFPGPPGRGTRREVERFIIDPNDVKTLRTGEAVLISKVRSARPEIIRVTQTPVASAREVGVDSRERGRFAVTMPTFRPPSAGARRQVRAAQSGAEPDRSLTGRGADARSRYPDPGVTR